MYYSKCSICKFSDFLKTNTALTRNLYDFLKVDIALMQVFGFLKFDNSFGVSMQVVMQVSGA